MIEKLKKLETALEISLRDENDVENMVNTALERIIDLNAQDFFKDRHEIESIFREIRSIITENEIEVKRLLEKLNRSLKDLDRVHRTISMLIGN